MWPNKSYIKLFKFFKKILVDTCPFVGLLIPLFWTFGYTSSGFQSQSWQPYSHLAEVYVRFTFNTCWPLGGQHGSLAILIHILANKHWWGLRLGSRYYAAASQYETRKTLYWLSYAGSACSKIILSVCSKNISNGNVNKS